jgi:hypothetical protein
VPLFNLLWEFIMQKSTNASPATLNRVKKSDGFINLKVIFTDASGEEHHIKAPMFGLDAADPLQAALIANPSLAEHMTVTIESIRPATPERNAADFNLNFESLVESQIQS